MFNLHRLTLAILKNCPRDSLSPAGVDFSYCFHISCLSVVRMLPEMLMIEPSSNFRSLE